MLHPLHRTRGDESHMHSEVFPRAGFQQSWGVKWGNVPNHPKTMAVEDSSVGVALASKMGLIVVLWYSCIYIYIHIIF